MALFSKKSASNTPPRRRQDLSRHERATTSELNDRYSFRRNRTLTGSASSEVSSLSERKAQLKSPRVHAHELTGKRRMIMTTLGFVLLAATGLYFLLWQFTATVVVRADDPSFRFDDRYEAAIQEYMGAQPIERLRFLTNEARLTAYVQSKNPEVSSIEIGGASGIGDSNFAITFREPIAGWSIDGEQRYVDTTGVPFTENYYKAPSVQIIDNSGIRVESGRAVASNRFLEFVGRVVGLSPDYGYDVTEVIIPPGVTRQVQLKVKGVSYPAKLSVDREAGKQVEDMARTFKWMKEHSKSPEYVDVRVGGKAFYRED